MTTAPQQSSAKPPRAGECPRCLHPLAEHEVYADRWGDVVRDCPEEDWWATDRERFWRGRREGYLS
jgi:hypothetical protein